MNNLKIKPSAVFGWTDSTVTLGWIKKHPATWNVFVANRVSTIQTVLPQATWWHVPTKSNPADCASRGQSPNDLATFSLWWNGPTWLALPPENWPKQRTELPAPLEERHAKVHVDPLNEPQITWDLAHRYSSWRKLVRITAYIRRFVNSTRKQVIPPARLAVTAIEIREAERFWAKYVQTLSFGPEIIALTKLKCVSRSSKILPLNPFLDENNIIRVGGRLRNSPLAEDTKFPYLLPRNAITFLLVAHAHEQAVHGSWQLTLRLLRERFWVIGARNLVKTYIRRCVVCARAQARLASQKMSGLPSFRTTPSRPFSHTGLDYAGPYHIRTASGRGHRSHKAYVVIFVCLCVRAIHIELAHDYTTSAFLPAFYRFTSRLGIPANLYSDNGPNLEGADRELKAAFRAVCQKNDLHSRFASDGTTWHFILPSAPHFGGMWEAGVKSIKHQLRRILGQTTPTVEEMTTLLCKIEACLNSRPIAPLRDEPDDFEALTPGHFLVGTSLKAVPIPSVFETSDYRLSRWQSVQKLLEPFWKVWASDYLQSLQKRYRWKTASLHLRQGDIVLMRNPNLPPTKWELGRVL